jgi:DNA-binding transcriptional ArsR family regulator
LLKAVSDNTRRALLTQLCQQGASRVTDLANHYGMSLNAISRHIKVLEAAGLVSGEVRGRTRLSVRTVWRLAGNRHFQPTTVS